MVEVPFTTRPEDIPQLFEKLKTKAVPAGNVDADYFKSLGFSASSGKQLLEILKKLEFIDETGLASAVWQEYASAANKGTVLGRAIGYAYRALFREFMSPYLEDDESLLDFFEHNIESTPRNRELILQTFRNLVEPADFQEFLAPDDAKDVQPLPGGASVKMDPNLHVSIQVHIDPNTPDEKIETIFKNMRKYLLGKTE